MKKLLLIDFSSLFHKSLHAYSDLSYKGKPTGALFGIIMQTATGIKEIRPDKVVYCLDSPPYHRYADCGDYKHHKEQSQLTEEEAEVIDHINRSKKICMDYLRMSGACYAVREGLEADDLIAIYTHLSHDYGEVVAMSNDSDLYQLFIHLKFSLYKGTKKGFYTAKDFFEEFGITPHSWNEVTSMTGGHNGLPGIKGIGIKTALRIIKEPEFREKKKELLINNKNLILLNRRLTRLPYYKLREWSEVFLEEKGGDKPSEKELIRYLSKYGISFSSFFRDANDQL